jgi:hypothetical protein
MAFTGMSPGYPHPIGTFSQGSQEKFGAHASGAGYSDDPDVGRITHSTHTGKVSSAVAAPVAQKADDFWFPV